ncbi:FAS1-like dehydratase domain-containing protein [Prauserella marina]|uniref:FAS1-like dehydratase domain-containing protein n=1 Tax=Prauserella marina TaxID=530584 RepID=UPI001472C3E2|nr:MaoC family dehydratase N-terminal domain-containing protein [Prauserella marina]
MEKHAEALRAELGRERAERLGVLDGRDIARFAVVTGQPERRDVTGAVLAPPTFLSSVMGWGAGVPDDELDGDGTAAEDTRGLPLEGVRLMGAGQELEFHAPVPAGTAVVVHTSLTDVRMKEGRTGPLLLLRILRRFTTDAGRALVTCHESFIAR